MSILAGEDASAMLYSNHFKVTKNLLSEFHIGQVSHYQPLFDSYEDEFFIALKERVHNYFIENKIEYRKTYKNIMNIIFTAMLLMSCWLCMYYLPPCGLLAAIPMGLATSSLIGYFGHEQIHGNLFPKWSTKRGYWLINNILWGIFIPFMPERYFQYEHIRHHNSPMDPNHDYDVYALKDFVRLSSKLPKKPHHNFQHIYAPFTYGIYIFLQLLGGYTTTFFDEREILKDKGNIRDIVFSSTIAFSFHIAIPIYLTNIWWVTIAAGLYFFTWQTAIYVSSGLPHMTKSKVQKNKLNSWSFHVCATTNNLKAGNRFFNWVTGGLNCHLNHHLLPSIPQEHLNSITPIVEKTCKEFGYPYHNYLSFKDYYMDHYQFLKDLGCLDNNSEYQT